MIRQPGRPQLTILLLASAYWMRMTQHRRLAALLMQREVLGVPIRKWLKQMSVSL
jgi:uncharacterized membrane protein YbaN (DUF454 family)